MILMYQLHTLTMSNITVINYDDQSPMVTCVIDMSDQNTFTCHVHKMWVDKGEGKIVVRFRNNADFRTIVQVDIKNILVEFDKSLPTGCEVTVASIYDNHQQLIGLGIDTFSDVWTVCNNTLMIGQNLFDVSQTHIEFLLADYE